MKLDPVDGGLVAERLGLRIAQMTVDHQVLVLQCENLIAQNEALRNQLAQIEAHDAASG